VLPFHSAAASGGGMGEDFLKDMMNEMQGLPPGAAGPAGGGGGNSQKKPKRKIIRA